MSAYADSGFLCSLYAPDAHTRRAVAHMRRQALPLPFIWLHQLELRNALRLRVFRAEITAPQRDASLNAVLADLAAGVLITASPTLADLMTEAERLSALHSETLGTRQPRHSARRRHLGPGPHAPADIRPSASRAGESCRPPSPRP